jgi:hypothetical protein
VRECVLVDGHGFDVGAAGPEPHAVLHKHVVSSWQRGHHTDGRADKQTERERGRVRERKRERGRERDRERKSKRERQTDRQTDRQRQRDRVWYLEDVSVGAVSRHVHGQNQPPCAVHALLLSLLKVCLVGGRAVVLCG